MGALPWQCLDAIGACDGSRRHRGTTSRATGGADGDRTPAARAPGRTDGAFRAQPGGNVASDNHAAKPSLNTPIAPTHNKGQNTNLSLHRS